MDITLDNCEINYGKKTFMIVSGTNFWGRNNGGNVYLKIINLEIHGDFIVDVTSYLKINLINSTLIGNFNHQIKNPGKIDIIIDPRSKLEITDESYINILNQKSDNSNIKNYTKSDKNIRNISVKDFKDDIKTDSDINKEETKENEETENAIKNEEHNNEKDKGTNLQSNGESSTNNGKYMINISILNILYISLLFR